MSSQTLPGRLWFVVSAAAVEDTAVTVTGIGVVGRSVAVAEGGIAVGDAVTVAVEVAVGRGVLVGRGVAVGAGVSVGVAVAVGKGTGSTGTAVPCRACTK